MDFDSSRIGHNISTFCDRCSQAVNHYQRLSWNDSVYRSFQPYASICSGNSKKAEDCEQTCIRICNQLTALEIEQTLTKINADIAEAENLVRETTSLLAEVE